MMQIIGALIFAFAYPWNVAILAVETPWPMLGWLAVGIVVLLLLPSRSRWFLRRIWVVLWFMPGAIICGAAATVPWPFALWAHFKPGNCATYPDLLIAVAINAVVVFGFAELWARMRRRRVANAKAV
jgi:hypothetical protein